MTPASDYRALLETTRALVIAGDGAPLSEIVICGEEAASPEAGTSDSESDLKRGEIVHLDPSEREVENNEGPTREAESSETEPDLRFRIYLGMS